MALVKSFSTNRLPGDNFLSGALLGLIGGGALNYAAYKKGEIDGADAVKKTLKFSVNSAIAAGFAISASNNFVRKNYLGAASDLALGLGLLALSNKYLDKKDKND